LLKHGLVDQVVDRREMRGTLAFLLEFFAEASRRASSSDVDVVAPTAGDVAGGSAGESHEAAGFSAPPLVPVEAAEEAPETVEVEPEADELLRPEPDEEPATDSLEKVARVETRREVDNARGGVGGWFQGDDAPSPGTP
jgi:hypothetical protein